MDHPGYTIREIARELGLPESTIRYYRDAFALYLPTIGQGRRRRYPLEALELLRLIADGYARNLAREDIETQVQEVGGPATARAQPVPRSGPPPPPRAAVPAVTAVSHDPAATFLEDERERRDLMWQMAREIVRMGERLERQQMMLGEIALRLEAGRALAGDGLGIPALPPGGTGPGSPNEVEQELASELQTLREELERERELVERLRRSKLEIERRATSAEAELRERLTRR